MKIIFDYNRTLFNPDTGNLYPYVLSILSTLSKNHELFLVSRNDPRRESMLVSLGISSFFKKKLFVDTKTATLFKDLIGDREQAIVIGDRIKGEIFIGNQLGYITIWLRQGKFMNDLPETKEEQPNHTIDEINQLLSLINTYE
jgi:FMN phosphatase YigB (HAD superfamily)